MTFPHRAAVAKLSFGALLSLTLLVLPRSAPCAESISREEVLTTMRRAATFFRTKVATHGGYVYYYSPDFSRRLGEGKATEQQIWVQPPGTPTVGRAYLKAFEATGDTFYLDAAREAAEALIYGQLESGGWTYSIDFDPQSRNVAQYRNGKGRGRNHSSLDDGTTQSALSFLMHMDRALDFKHPEIHEAVKVGLDALLAAQFPSGGFPQGWTGPAPAIPPSKAAYPDYNWRTENRIKNYWDMPTLNDGLCGSVATALVDGWEIYKEPRCKEALTRLGDFLILAQMPEPQPAWAQQYDFQMRPIWARKFEPPAIAGVESVDAMKTLLRIYQITGDAKYLKPVGPALTYLKRSRLPDGRLARYYELQSNKPLYMTREYQLTYDDSDLPNHYGWKTEVRLESIESALTKAKTRPTAGKTKAPPSEKIREIITTLDTEGRWMSTYTGQSLVGQPKFQPGDVFIASETFSRNLEALSNYLKTR